MSKANPRIVIAGGVSSTRRTLQGLLRHGANVVGILGLSAELAERTSGYSRLDDLPSEAVLPYQDFRNINSPDVVEMVRSWKPDLLFVVGLSQLVKEELLGVPALGAVGFHPTWLPKGRGRAPVAWLALDGSPGAATFFLMDEGMDSGPILAQAPFFVSEEDYAANVLDKTEQAIDAALDHWLPELKAGKWEPTPQEHTAASYHGKRAPEDGLIDWNQPAEQIQALVRAASHPHPGAYTYVGAHRLIVWRAQVERQLPFRGVTGRILEFDAGKGWLVQAGSGLLWLTESELITDESHGKPAQLRIGTKLGFTVEDELFRLKQTVADLERRLADLESR